MSTDLSVFSCILRGSLQFTSAVNRPNPDIQHESEMEGEGEVGEVDKVFEGESKPIE